MDKTSTHNHPLITLLTHLKSPPPATQANPSPGSQENTAPKFQDNHATEFQVNPPPGFQANPSPGFQANPSQPKTPDSKRNFHHRCQRVISSHAYASNEDSHENRPRGQIRRGAPSQGWHVDKEFNHPYFGLPLLEGNRVRLASLAITESSRAWLLLGWVLASSPPPCRWWWFGSHLYAISLQAS
ncbi:hypothetical protein J6590_004439 [Homalodisca vitripennis]|nr:hypothetical protein J6590_004439 [Homalodisca vitripennis]